MGKNLESQLIANDVEEEAIKKILEFDLNHYQGSIELYFDKEGNEEIPYRAEIVLVWTTQGYRLKFTNFHN
jgi:hypothetical protein